MASFLEPAHTPGSTRHRVHLSVADDVHRKKSPDMWTNSGPLLIFQNREYASVLFARRRRSSVVTVAPLSFKTPKMMLIVLISVSIAPGLGRSRACRACH